MNSLLLFLLELIVLWFLARRINSKLFRNLPSWFFVLIFMPGTFIHELSHFLMAKILFVRVGHFSLIPQKYNKEIILGSVAIEKKDIFRRSLIGIAPVILGTVVLFSIMYLSISYNIYKDFRIAILISYFVFVVGNTMFSSRKDLEGAWIVAILLVAILIGLYVLGVRIHIESNHALKLLNSYLLVPIAIDAVIVCALSLKRR